MGKPISQSGDMKQSDQSLKKLILIALLAVALMSFVPVTIKWLSANEATIGLVRLAIGTLGISLLLFFQKHKQRPSRKDLFWLIVLGGTFAIHWYSYFKSIKLADASLAAMGVATFGIHLLLLRRIFYAEKLKLSDFIALSLAIVGLMIATPDVELAPDKALGFGLAIISGALYAVLPQINRHIIHLSTNLRAQGQFGFALLFFSGLLPWSNFDLDTETWWGLIFLGVVCTLIAHTLWLKASTELPANLTAVLYYCYLPLTMLTSFWFLDEEIGWQKLLGAGLIISANILVVLRHRKAGSD